MFREKLSDYYDRDVIFSIIMGIIVGLLVVYICIIFNLAIWGFNIYLIFAPLIAGFVETYLSQKLTNTTSGAISSIVLFIVTNLIGWLFPAQAITWNVFTIGGIAIMLQAAFPLTVNYILIFLLLLFVYIFGRIGGFIGLLFDKNSPDNMVFEMETLCLLFINMVVFYLYNEILKAYTYKIDKLVLEQKISMYANQLDTIMKTENKIRGLQHDMKHHIIQLELMAKQNGQSDIEEYLQNMADFMSNPEEVVHTGNLDIDSVLNYMISKAEQVLKEVNVKVNIPSDIASHFNINVIIGNLLENAIEAAVNTENKILDIDIHYKQGVLYLDISNSYSNKVTVKEHRFLTSKEDDHKHGIGLYNVKKMVEEHNGVLQFCYDEDMFRVKIMMYAE